MAFWVGWTVTAVFAQPGYASGQSETFEKMSRWESFKDHMSASPGMFLLIAVPSLILLLLIGYRGQAMPKMKLRTVAGVLLMLPLWFLLIAGDGTMLATQIAVQGLFAAVAIPAPAEPDQH
ncbi:hypothetical protein [Streptomyces sp. YS-3]|uniref:hypothetical protein n=1 Tax=Streptomyces sp. YS-3 TaxID=3381352 RepID=UPI0038627DD0